MALDHFGVPYIKTYSAGELSGMLADGGMAIVKKWNNVIQHYDSIVGYGSVPTYKSPNYFGGTHIVLVAHSGDGIYRVYNRYSNSPQLYTYGSFEEYLGQEVAYYVGFYLG